MKTIQLYPLRHGKVALVDDADHERLAAFHWTATERKSRSGDERTWYAVRTVTAAPGKRRMILMHREIVGAPPGSEVDHRNSDGLDNRRANIRLCTTQQNSHNSRPRVRSGSAFKGVSWSASGGAWIAQIKTGDGYRNLGLYSSEEDAARVYDQAAREAYGTYAWLNFPNDSRSVASSRRAKASRYRGVMRSSKPNRPSPWVASIRVNGKSRYLGAFATEEAAAEAYNAAAQAAFGERASLNAIAGGRRLKPEGTA